jgi:hypothetical protein
MVTSAISSKVAWPSSLRLNLILSCATGPTAKSTTFGITRDTSDLEALLTGASHNAPIYLSYDTTSLAEGFAHVKTSDAASNSAIKKIRLQNVISTINASSSADRQRVAVISAPLDSFSLVPTAQLGANNNGLAVIALLEVMHQISKFPPANNWVFVFALTDGHFCHFEGFENVVSGLTGSHAGEIEFGGRSSPSHRRH